MNLEFNIRKDKNRRLTFKAFTWRVQDYFLLVLTLMED